MWINPIEPEMSQMTLPYGTCWITTATNTHSVYVIVIVFPRQQCLRQHFWVLRYTYIAGHVLNSRHDSC